MRRLFAVAVLLGVAGCQQQVVVPTAQELANNPSLLAEWQAKCSTGEYSHLDPAQKATLCTTTDQAVTSVAMKKSSSADSDFFNAISKKK